MVMIEKLIQQQQQSQSFANKNMPILHPSTDESSHDEDCETDEKRLRLESSTKDANLIHKLKYKKYLLNGDPITPPEENKSPSSGDELNRTSSNASIISELGKLQNLNFMDHQALVDYMIRSRSSSAESSNSFKSLLPIQKYPSDSGDELVSPTQQASLMKQMMNNYHALINRNATANLLMLNQPAKDDHKEAKVDTTNEITAKITNVSSKSSSQVSTPCKVCGDEASGFHYGVDSCEGCKGFFRRCITQGMNHQCTNNQQCEITPFSRNSCQFCRLKKCFVVGMSREASRLGRRPKRPRDENSSSSTPVKQQNQSVQKDENIEEPHISQPPFRLDPEKKPQNQVNASIDEDTDSETSISVKNEHDALNTELLSRLIEVCDRYLSFERVNELEIIRCTLIEAYCLSWPATQIKIGQKCKINPPTEPKNVSQFLDENSIETLVPLIMDVVKFCKYIPGFSDLLQQDQVQLIKQGSFEVICLNSFFLVDTERKLMISPDLENIFDRQTLKTTHLGFFYVDIFDLALQNTHLKLTDSEVALFNAVLIINSSRDDLICRDKVHDLRATVLHVLFRHLKQNRRDEPELFFKLLKLMPQIEALNHKHAEALNMLQMKKVPTLKARKNSEGSDGVQISKNE